MTINIDKIEDDSPATNPLLWTGAGCRSMYISKWLRNGMVLVILLLPFQGLLPTLMGLRKEGTTGAAPVWVSSISYIDEISFFIILGIGVTFFCLNPTVYRFPRVPLTKWILVFIAFGFVLGIIKGIPFLQATFAIYDLFKNMAILYVFAMVNNSEEEFFRLIKLIIGIGLLLAVIAIFSEFMALTFNYGIGIFVADFKRWGIYRIYSLTGSGSHNYIGLYGILCFLLTYAFIQGRELSYLRKILLVFMVILTMSRQSWSAFLITYVLFKQWLRYYIILLPIIIFIIIYSLGVKHEIDPDAYLRLYAYLESIKIVLAHPFTGLGPGMFGDLASILWKSPVYDKWPIFFQKYVMRIHSIDAFWPVIWGSYGLTGLALYCSIWLSLFSYLGKATKRFYDSGSDKFYNIGKALKYFMVALIVMGFAGGLNAAFVTYTYFAIVGIYISLYKKIYEKDNLRELAQET